MAREYLSPEETLDHVKFDEEEMSRVIDSSLSYFYHSLAILILFLEHALKKSAQRSRALFRGAESGVPWLLRDPLCATNQPAVCKMHITAVQLMANY